MIRVLIVDDSALMRKILADILTSDPEIEVIGTAMNGRYAIEKVKKLNPDVITMDIMMPEIGGIDAIKVIMRECPTPIVIVSAYTKKDSQHAIEGMEAGAVDFIQKPSGEISTDMESIRDQIITKVKAASTAKVKNLTLFKPKIKNFKGKKRKIIVIGASTGGPQTLECLLTGFPKNIPAPILIAQHMPPEFTKSFAVRLDQICEIEVKEAEDGDILKNGSALVAPGGFHMIIEREDDSDLVKSGRVKLIKDDAGELGPKPSVDMLFRSVAKIFEENTVGVILTGMGRDGTNGAKAIKDKNGIVIAESKESSIIYGMPKSVIEANLADKIIDIDEMAAAIIAAVEI